MFDCSVDAAGGADFTSIKAAVDHYGALPWWKRGLVRLFPARITIADGDYPETVTVPPGILFMVQPRQELTTTIDSSAALRVRKHGS